MQLPLMAKPIPQSVLAVREARRNYELATPSPVTMADPCPFNWGVHKGVVEGGKIVGCRCCGVRA